MLTILGLAIALGTDAFSMAIGIGMNGVNWKENLKISTTIGIAHIIMPLIGYYLGRISGKILGTAAGFLGGAILIGLGGLMFRNRLRQSKKKSLNIDYRSGLGLLALATGVSLDALSVGFSLGTIGVSLWITIVLLGLISAVMTLGGLVLGGKIGKALGDSAEVLGAIILISLGVKIIYELASASVF